MRSDARLNEERLVAAAVAAVHREGPLVPMATVAADAGVGVGTLYRRFPTRAALLDALTHRSFELVLAAAEAADGAGGTGLAALSRFLDATLGHRDQLVLPLHGGPPVGAGAAAVQASVHRALGGILERGRADGSVRAGVAARDVIVFGAMLAQPLATVTDWDATGRRLTAIFLTGIAGPAATGSGVRSSR